MGIFYRLLSPIAAITFFMSLSGCSTQTIQAGPSTPETLTYKQVLGKPLNNDEVNDFILSSHCASAAQFWLCKEAGVALLIDTNQVVDTVYLYLNNSEGFSPYKGELPVGLKFYDTLGAVEYKLNREGLGDKGLPDEGGAPDHLHYRAVYNQIGVTILYNEPYPDEDATIYAILVSSQYLSYLKEENGLHNLAPLLLNRDRECMPVTVFFRPFMTVQGQVLFPPTSSGPPHKDPKTGSLPFRGGKL